MARNEVRTGPRRTHAPDHDPIQAMGKKRKDKDKKRSKRCCDKPLRKMCKRCPRRAVRD